MIDVLIIGGGLAGLATSVALAESGLKVTLLESRPRLGGRASSIEDPTTGEVIDNCQHVAMGCCTNFLHFCRVTGLDAFLKREDSLTFIGPPDVESKRPPRFHKFRAWTCLPTPGHLAPALMGLSYLSFRDKRTIAAGLLSLWRWPAVPSERISFAEWLKRSKQSETAIARFWSVVLVSALSESLERISVAAARKVFVDGFLSNRHGWEVWRPIVALDDFYSVTLTHWLTVRGVEIRLKTGAEKLLVSDDRMTAVELRNGERLTANQFVLAVPHHRVLSLLPTTWQSHPDLTGIEKLETAPIASVHLWFDRPITSLPHAVLIGRLGQWLFHRGQGSGVSSQRSDEQLFYYQVVISYARDVAERSQSDVIAEVVAELTAIWPAAAAAELRHSRMIVEHKAVFSPLPESDELRTAQQSPIANLQLAGDWTRTAWPSTMESAVRSGFLAAENILRQTGRDAQWLQPDLPRSWFAR